MATLFDVYSTLQQLKEKNSLTQEQTQFLDKILKGAPGWRPFAAMMKSPQLDEFSNLHKALEEELSKYPDAVNKPLTKLAEELNTTPTTKKKSEQEKDPYLSALKFAKLGAYVVIKNKKDLNSTSESESLALMNHCKDILYKETIDKYHGTIMMPINQFFDSRQVVVEGCSKAYVTKWARQILMKERPFGLDMNQKQTLQPVRKNSILGSKYHDINHFAVLTEEINNYHRAYKEGRTIMLEKVVNASKTTSSSASDAAASNTTTTDNTTSDATPKSTILINPNPEWSLHKDPSEIAKLMLEEAQKKPNTVLETILSSHKEGNSIGFCIVEGKYHLLDSNSGWYRFDNEKDFMDWFPFYHKQSWYSYDLKNICNFSTYSLGDPKAEKANEPWTAGMIALAVILSPLIVVGLVGAAVVGIGWLAYTIGSLIVDINSLKNEYKVLEEREKKGLTDELLPLIDKRQVYKSKSIISTGEIPLSLKGLDLPLPQKKKPKKSDLDYLGLEVKHHKDLRKAPTFFNENKKKEELAEPESKKTLKP